MHAVAITGASGSIIGIKLIYHLIKSGNSVGAVVSESGWQTMYYEMFRNKERPETVAEALDMAGLAVNTELLHEYKNDDFFSPIVSGTGKWDSITIAPASMKTVAAVANGYADTVITRAFDVALKERKRCILVPRETPFNLIHLRNLTAVVEAGAVVVPPVPAYYLDPETIDDVTDFICGKILTQLDIDHGLIPHWGKKKDRI